MKYLFLFISLILFSCDEKQSVVVKASLSKEQQDVIIEETLKNAYGQGMNSVGFQEEMNKGLAKDSTIAHLWQQKSMPLYKQGKYEVGRPFLDKAVKFNRERYLDYRAFMLCIFSKKYREAILEFEKCIAEYGNTYVMDHTYKCYIGISHLMLNEFEKAEAIFKEDLDEIETNKGEDWLHPLELFYYGISLYEQKKYEEAVLIFDRALEKYPKFSDVQYYKALSLARSENLEDAKELMKLAAKNAKLGNTINEDNVIYERYPYQVQLKTYEIYESN